MEEIEKNKIEELKYFTTWSTAISMITFSYYKKRLLNKSLRQIIHISASGNSIRLKLSNKNGKSNLEIKEINIADSLSQGTSEINIHTIKNLTFNCKKDIIIPPGEEIYSDTISYDLKPLSEIAISMFLGEIPEVISGHLSSRTHSFIEEGNKINEKKFQRKKKMASWFFISDLEVSCSPVKKTIVCFGDSITNGSGSTKDKQNRWIDLLAKKLYLNKNTSNIAIVNKGLSGDKITTKGLERFSNDVLEVKGIAYILLLYGVNDINENKSSNEIISAYQQIIKESHKNHIFIYAGTILPFGNCKKWTEEKEKTRQEINNWIRNTKAEDGGFDFYFDYDKLLKDPDDETKLYKNYDKGDGLHPSPEGHKKIVDAIDNLELFTKEPNFSKDIGI